METVVSIQKVDLKFSGDFKDFRSPKMGWASTPVQCLVYWNVHGVLVYTQYTGYSFLKNEKTNMHHFVLLNFHQNNCYSTWGVFPGSVSNWAADTADQAMGRRTKSVHMDAWVLALMMRLDSDGGPDMKPFNYFFQRVRASLSLPSYSNEKALMLDWKINWMDIKEGLNPAVNIWALGCWDYTADSALKPLKAFCVWVVFMTGAIFHLGLDRATRVTVAVNLTLICLRFVWCVQRGRSSRSGFSP